MPSTSPIHQIQGSPAATAWLPYATPSASPLGTPPALLIRVPERRRASRPDSPDRRSFPRPPLWLNFLLLAIAIATFAYAKHQRDDVRERMALLFKPGPSNPAELNRIREDLSAMELTKGQLAKELNGRMQFLQDVKSSQFYIAIDTSKKKLYFRLGQDIVRDADITVGDPKTIQSPDKTKTWTFVPVKGAFTVKGKRDHYDWPVPDWVFAMRGQNPPAERPVIPNGLGTYVIELPDNYVIHTPPPETSPLAGTPKPGSIMVPEDTLAAIWPRISNQTRVYIF